MIVSVNGKSLAGKTSDESTALIKGPAGTHGALGVREGAAQELTLKRAKVDIPIVECRMERHAARRSAWVRLAGFTSGSGEDVKKAVNKELRRRGRGRSCSTCATTAAGC